MEKTKQKKIALYKHLKMTNGKKKQKKKQTDKKKRIKKRNAVQISKDGGFNRCVQ